MNNAYTDLERDEKCDLVIQDIQSFDYLYHKYHHIVYANILKIVKLPVTAEDILQDVFVSLWENRHKLKGPSIEGWLFVVSYNKSISFLKRSIKLSVDYVENYRLFDQLISEEDLDESIYLSQVMILEKAVNALPKRKKEVFKLCRLEGKSKEEVASILGISPVSVGDYLKQSNKAIRNYVLAHYPENVMGLLLLILTMA